MAYMAFTQNYSDDASKARTMNINLDKVASISENAEGGCTILYISGQSESYNKTVFGNVFGDLRRSGDFILGTGDDRQLVMTHIAASDSFELIAHENKMTSLSAIFHLDPHGNHRQVLTHLSRGEVARLKGMIVEPAI